MQFLLTPYSLLRHTEGIIGAGGMAGLLCCCVMREAWGGGVRVFLFDLKILCIFASSMPRVYGIVIYGKKCIVALFRS